MERDKTSKPKEINNKKLNNPLRDKYKTEEVCTVC